MSHKAHDHTTKAQAKRENEQPILQDEVDLARLDEVVGGTRWARQEAPFKPVQQDILEVTK